MYIQWIIIQPKKNPGNPVTSTITKPQYSFVLNNPDPKDSSA